jgi:hypothetical protein
MKHTSLRGSHAPFAAALPLLLACSGPAQPEQIAFADYTVAPSAAADPEACVANSGLSEVRAYAIAEDGSAVVATGPAYGSAGTAVVHKLDAACHTVWTFQQPPGDTLWILRVAAEPSGDVIVAGSVSSASETDPELRSGGALLLMKLDGEGHLRWRASSRLGGRLMRILFAPAGEIVVSGRVRDPHSGHRWDMVARYDAAGHEQWEKPFGNARAHVNDLAVSDAGDVVVGGFFADPFDFGGGLLSPTHGPDTLDTFDAFLVKVDAAGAHRWSARFGDAQSQSIDRVTIAASGEITARGAGNGTIDLGGGPLALGDNGTFAARFDADGHWLWSGPDSASPPPGE